MSQLQVQSEKPSSQVSLSSQLPAINTFPSSHSVHSNGSLEHYLQLVSQGRNSIIGCLLSNNDFPVL